MSPACKTFSKPRTWRFGLLVLILFAVGTPCHADLQSAPVWFDTNAAGTAPDWHYRVPIDIPSGAAANSTIRVDVDFNALLAGLGISGTFDAASPRVVRGNGSPAAVQQFADTVYGGSTDVLNNARGEVRFILEDAGPTTYQLYFDIVQNGAKAPWPAADTINGNFEFAAAGQSNPAGWTAAANPGFDAEVRPAENPAISSDTTGADTPYVSTDGSPHSGQFAYLMGARSQNEPGNAYPAVTLSRTITVAAINPGDLTLRYRLEGWDSSADGSNQYDFIRIRLIGSSTVELVGPTAGNYGIFPFAPNYGTGAAGPNQSGYGQYNGWDTDTNGNHHYTPPMTLNSGDQPWFTLSASLNGFAGQTITLEITSNHYNQYRSWCHLDDVEWSIVAGTLGSPQAFGADVTAPASAYTGAILSISASVDAQSQAVRAEVRDDSGTMVAGSIVLFDDGTHGDPTANDGNWTNDGSDPGNPTYTIPAGATVGSSWSVSVSALDASASNLTTTDGLVHIPGQPTAPETPANYFNIDSQAIAVLLPAADLSASTKSVVDVNGDNLHPGDVLRYTINIIESAGIPATDVHVSDVIPAHLSGFSVVSIPAGATDASTPDGTGPNGTGYLEIAGIDLAGGGSAAIVFEAIVSATAATGATIDNTALVTVAGGTGASPDVSTPPVTALPAAGNKVLYLRTDSDLSRIPPAGESDRRIGRNRSHGWTLTPVLQQPLIISAGTATVPVRLMIRHSNANSGDRSTTIDIALSGIGALNNVPIIVNGTVQAYTFNIPVAPPTPITVPAGSAPVLTVGAGNEAIRVFTTHNGTPSRLLLDVDTVINVDSAGFYDAAYPGGTVVTSTRPGDTVYLRAVVSDPFGSFDITAANVDISGPLGTTNSPMTEVQDSGAATKIFESPLTLPAFGSDGTWTAVVTANEGTEGTISHQGTATLDVGAPLLTVLKSANSATAGPGDLITYTVQVVNTGSGEAVAIQLDDAMSPYTALRIAYDGTDSLPFRLVAAPGGVTLGAPVYSDDDGATYGYGPLSSGGSGAPAGYDGSVTHWQLPVIGTLGGNGDGFTLRYQVIVK